MLLQLICEQSDKICEMAAVMEHAADTDDSRAFSEQQLVSKLTTENKVSTKCQLLTKGLHRLLCIIFILGKTRQSRYLVRNHFPTCKYCTCLYFHNMFRSRCAITR
jgi:hypothetical protein